MNRESTLEAMVRELRCENDELRFERACLWALVVALLAVAVLHLAAEHSTI